MGTIHLHNFLTKKKQLTFNRTMCILMNQIIIIVLIKQTKLSYYDKTKQNYDK